MDTCPVCTEELTVLDQLSCGHNVHNSCVKQSADTLQDYLVEQGYPPLQYARCPICRADLADIPVKPSSWFGEITLNNEQLQTLVQLLEDGEGMVTTDSIPVFVSEQMPNAHQDEQLNFTFNAATILWLTKDRPFPAVMKIRRKRHSSRRGRFGCRIVFPS